MNWKRGLWRTWFVVWIVGGIGLSLWEPKLLQPFKPVHPAGQEEPQEFVNESPEGSYTWRLKEKRRQPWEYANPVELEAAHARWEAERLPAFRTRDYHFIVLGFGVLLVGWTIVLWGVFYIEFGWRQVSAGSAATD
jgi:hypothetical protein